MDERSTSVKLIQWICFATRPLSLDELRWAMVVEADGSHQSLDECQRSENYMSDNGRMKRRIQTLSCGLTEAIPSSDVHVVQFIYQSVKDFFVEKGLLALDCSLTSTDAAVGMAHFRLSRICIRDLAMKEINRTIMSDEKRRFPLYKDNDFPFLPYATTSWIAHTKQGDAKGVPQEDLLELFAWPTDALMELWVRAYYIIDKFSYDCPPRGTSLVHVMSMYQILGPLRVILQRAA